MSDKIFAELAAQEAKDERLAQELQDLEVLLKDRLLPPMTRDAECVTMPRQAACVCILAAVADVRLVRLVEGGRQMPHGVVLALTPRWLSRKPVEGESTVDLFMHRGISFDAHGQSRLMTYNPPRRVTYFTNLLTKAVNGDTNEGYDFELGLGRWAEDPLAGRLLACPRSSSPKLELMVGDKLLTRLLMVQNRVAVPDTLAYVFKGRCDYPSVGGAHVVVKRWEEVAVVDWASVREDVVSFLGVVQRKTDQVVVKPSGHLWMGSQGVSFHSFDADDIVAAIKALATQLHDGDGLLVEEFCSTLPPQDVLLARELPLRAVLDPGFITETNQIKGAVQILKAEQAVQKLGAQAGGGKLQAQTRKLAEIARIPVSVMMGFRVRVLVQRNDEGEPAIAKIVCAVGPSDEPLHGANSLPQTLQLTLQQWGFSSSASKDVEAMISRDARSAFLALARFEESLTAEQKGGPEAATDFIGLDVLLTYRKGVIVPVVIEVNDHDCLRHSFALEDVFPEGRGECVRPHTRNALHKSQSFLQKKAVLVIIGGGGHSKGFVWDLLREHGFHVVLVDGQADHFAKSKVSCFVHVPQVDVHHDDLATAKLVVQRLAEAGYPRDSIDGCMTYWEDCSPLAAAVAELLGTNGNPYEAHLRAKSKFQTHAYLGTKTSDFPVTVPSIRVRTLDQLREALKKVTLPALLKLEYGSSAVGVILVETKEEAESEFTRLTTELATEADHSGAGLSFAEKDGPSMVLMEYIDGSEHQLDILMYEGEMLFNAISDYSPTKLPYFNELAICMPTRLHPHRQKTLAHVAYRCLRDMGLNTGAFNVGLKYSKRGPRLVEINARMGGFCLRDWIKRIYGVDMAACAAMIAAGQRPVCAVQRAPRTRIVGMMLYASDAGDALRNGGLETLRRLHDSEHAVFNQFEAEIPDAAEFEEPVANIACSADDFTMGFNSLSTILHSVGINKAGGVPIEWYFENL